MSAGSAGGGNGLPRIPAIVRIASLLRSIDDKLAALRAEGAPGRLLSVPEAGGDLGPVLSPLEEVLGEAVHRLGLHPEPVDMRQRTRGPLYLLWADLVDMAPDRLEKHWGAHDVPEAWPELRRQLLAAVEEAIAVLGPAPAPASGPLPPTGRQ